MVHLVVVLLAVLAGGVNSSAQAQTQSQSRVALVVGNSSYQHVAPLKSPMGDATAIAESLTRLGFAVNHLTDANYDTLRRALLEFGQSARRANIAVIYFAGHGIEVNGENWVIPVDAQLQYDSDVETEAIALRSLMLSVSSAKDLGLVILDACRENPFASTMRLSKGVRAIDRGLERVEPNDNILVAYAARPGTIAQDRPSPHSAFTEAILKNIEIPGLEINYVFRNVHDEVLEATDDEQEPVHYGSLSEKEIYLRSPSLEAALPESVPTAEEIAWSFLRDSVDIQSLGRFAEQFPASIHVTEAKARMASLEKAAQSPPRTATTADEIAWTFVNDNPDLPTFRRFLELFPNSAHFAEVRARIESLEPQSSFELSSSASKPAVLVDRQIEKKSVPVVRRVLKDDGNVQSAWRLIKNTSDPNVLRKFAAEFPNRQYTNDVNTRLAELGIDPDRARRASRLPPKEAAEYYVDQCDRLAADPGDASRRSRGVEFGQLSPDAVDACRHAVAVHPELPRLQFQLCRCLIKTKKHDEAFEHCDTAAQLAQAQGDKSATLYVAAKSASQTLIKTGYDPNAVSVGVSAAPAGQAGSTTGIGGAGSSAGSALTVSTFTTSTSPSVALPPGQNPEPGVLEGSLPPPTPAVNTEPNVLNSPPPPQPPAGAPSLGPNPGISVDFYTTGSLDSPGKTPSFKEFKHLPGGIFKIKPVFHAASSGGGAPVPSDPQLTTGSIKTKHIGASFNSITKSGLNSIAKTEIHAPNAKLVDRAVVQSGKTPGIAITEGVGTKTLAGGSKTLAVSIKTPTVNVHSLTANVPAPTVNVPTPTVKVPTAVVNIRVPTVRIPTVRLPN
jgi:hypothetical protein